MSGPGNEELGKRIRTLTALLHRLKVQKAPSKRAKDILSFLSHFTTLLICSDKDDRQAQKVIAVTGSIDADYQARTLIVCQNPYLRSTVKNISLELIQKDKRPLEQVVNGPPDPPFINHVADVWAALSAFIETPGELDYADRLEIVELFFLSRSHRKFVTRFKEDSKLCGGRKLYEVIAKWQPDRPEITTEWVRPLGWLLDFEGLPSIKSRVVQGEVEWEFSDGTKKAWSKILEIILIKVYEAIEQVKVARELVKKTQEEVHKAMMTLNGWCRTLYYFVVWKAGIVKSLLTKTNMVADITTTFMPMRSSDPVVDETDGDGAELLQEPGESKGEQIYRYLKTVVAWHHAVSRFSRDAKLPKLLEEIQIGLVEVPPSPTTVMTLPQIFEEFFARFSDMTEIRDEVLKVLTAHHSNMFSGCIHAEATLMGLINYYVHETKYANRDAAVMNAQHMWDIIQPVVDAGSVAISVSKKCCWCCDWLGQQLETRFMLPGTHGLMYPWDPPTVGISRSVLQLLEKSLWNELHHAVFNLVLPSYSHQSSAPSSPEGMEEKEMERPQINFKV